MRFPSHVCLAWKWLGNCEENAIFSTGMRRWCFTAKRWSLKIVYFAPLINIMYRWMLVPVSVIFIAECHYVAKRWLSNMVQILETHIGIAIDGWVLNMQWHKIERLCKFKSVWSFMIIQQNVVCFTRSAGNKIEVTCENMHTN